jgi:CheY-like chemotaxis protein
MPQPTTGRSRPTRTTATRVGPVLRSSRSAPAHALNLAWIKSAALLKLILLAALFLPNQPVGAAAPYADEYDETAPELNYYVKERNQRIASEQQERFRKRVAIREATSDDVLEAHAKKQQSLNQTPAQVKLPPITNRGLFFIALGFVTGFLLVRKLAPELLEAINKRFNPWAQTAATVANLSARVRAEDEAFSEFVASFRTGPQVIPLSGSRAAGDTASATSRGLLMEFHANAPKILRTLQNLVQEIGQSTRGSVQHRMLADLRRELRALKGEAGLPELLPVWQMTSALEGLVKQLTDKASDVNHSTLRTVANGMELLKDLCVPGVRADLLVNPPFRLLAVDDDPISRNAVSLALRKAFNTPDLAENGESALALAMDNAYDAIFLDVQMPGMDGFELCTRIHDTVYNRTTPVVFVTCHSDFEARAQSTLSGGNDLIGKPFLTFEITVKALTLSLQARLQAAAEAPVARRALSSELLEATSLPDWVAADLHQDNSLPAGENSPATGVTSPVLSPPRRVATIADVDSSISGVELSPGALLRAFLARATTNLGPLRDLIQTIFRVTDQNLRQEMLADFFLRFNSLAPKLDTAKEHPALRLCAALEGLLTKMLGNPKNCTSSTILTVATAVDLLIELCVPAVRPDLATNPAVRLLAVDDDPVARRAITSALQMTFEKPESVDSGESALVLAREKSFDAIFLDVEMPGMDGFDSCLRIRETELNRTTPVVFVTCHSDFKARSQSAISGGSDLMGKPFLPAEIRVKALTFVLRGRLQKSRTAPSEINLPREAAAKQCELVAA